MRGCEESYGQKRDEATVGSRGFVRVSEQRVAMTPSKKRVCEREGRCVRVVATKVPSSVRRDIFSSLEAHGLPVAERGADFNGYCIDEWGREGPSRWSGRQLIEPRRDIGELYGSNERLNGRLGWCGSMREMRERVCFAAPLGSS